MTSAARLEQQLVEEALDREVLACLRDEYRRAYRQQPSTLARRIVA